MATEQRVPASQTLYIKNLPEKIKKEDLKRVLYMLFTPFGPVLDVNARKTSKMRGQAHVLFRDVHAATQGMRSCQGMDFFGKPMTITYSKNRSDMLSKLTGTFAPSNPNVEQGSGDATTLTGFPTAPSGLPPPPVGLPSKPKGDAPMLKAPETLPRDTASPQGIKRQRGESDSEQEEDEDDEDEMDMSDSD